MLKIEDYNRKLPNVIMGKGDTNLVQVEGKKALWIAFKNAAGNWYINFGDRKSKDVDIIKNGIRLIDDEIIDKLVPTDPEVTQLYTKEVSE